MRVAHSATPTFELFKNKNPICKLAHSTNTYFETVLRSK
jgi:hypothetical protein